MKFLPIAVAVAALAAAAPAAAGGGPWDPLGGRTIQRVTIHIQPASHGREVVLDGNIAVVPDIPVALTVINTSREFHSFTIPQLHVNAVVMPGSPQHPRATKIRFTALSVGRYDWRCDFCPAVHHQGRMGGTVYALVTG